MKFGEGFYHNFSFVSKIYFYFAGFRVVADSQLPRVGETRIILKRNSQTVYKLKEEGGFVVLREDKQIFFVKSTDKDLTWI